MENGKRRGRAGAGVRSYSWTDLVAEGEERPAVDDRMVALVGAFNRAQQIIVELENACESIQGVTWAPKGARPPIELRLAQAKKMDEIFAAFYSQASLAGVARTVFLAHLRTTAHGAARPSGAAVHEAFGHQFPEYARRLTAADVDALLESRRGRGRPRGTAVPPRTQTNAMLDAIKGRGFELPEFQRLLVDAYRKMGIPASVENMKEVLRRPRHSVGIPLTEQMARRQKRSAKK